MCCSFCLECYSTLVLLPWITPPWP
jgi:hypothetical protein